MFSVGDVVLCKFPFSEDPNQYKKRPALIVRVMKPGCYLAAQITHKNRSDKIPGMWIEMFSKDGMAMGIRMDSFINARHLEEIFDEDIIQPIGTFPSMAELEAICRKYGIPL